MFIHIYINRIFRRSNGTWTGMQCALKLNEWSQLYTHAAGIEYTLLHAKRKCLWMGVFYKENSNNMYKLLESHCKCHCVLVSSFFVALTLSPHLFSPYVRSIECEQKGFLMFLFTRAQTHCFLLDSYWYITKNVQKITQPKYGQSSTEKRSIQIHPNFSVYLIHMNMIISIISLSVQLHCDAISHWPMCYCFKH